MLNILRAEKMPADGDLNMEMRCEYRLRRNVRTALLVSVFFDSFVTSGGFAIQHREESLTDWRFGSGSCQQQCSCAWGEESTRCRSHVSLGWIRQDRGACAIQSQIHVASHRQKKGTVDC